MVLLSTNYYVKTNVRAIKSVREVKEGQYVRDK